MTSSSTLLRTLLIYSLCLPLAIFVGYLIASPDPIRDYSTYFGVGLVVFLLCLPLLLKWHRALLVGSWKASVMLYFLPSRPELFYGCACFSLLVSVLQFIIHPRSRFLSVPQVTRPLIVLGIVVLFTAIINGGIGLGALGSETMGGKKYLVLLIGIMAFFALISQPIPASKAYLYIGLFFLGGLTQIIADLGPILFPSMPFLYWMFPLSGTSVQMILDNPDSTTEQISRFGGVAFAMQDVFMFLLAYYGIRNIFHARHPWRFLFFITVAVLSLIGGFRGTVITLGLTFALVFYCEGLMRSRLLPIFLLIFTLIGCLVFSYVDRLPFNIQRTLTIVPGLHVNEQASRSAEDSSGWRLDMWRHVLPEVPKYLLLGKGFALTAAEVRENISGGPNSVTQFSSEGSAKAGDFHNGPLSLLIPFGIWGFIGYTWFLLASSKVLYRNYKYGPPHLQTINTLLFALFIVKTIFFYFIFGSSFSDIVNFTGLVGLGVALNGGAVLPSPARAEQPRPQPIRFRPATRPIAAM
jgi:hypothetical protein